jgi:DNA polymerase-4
MAQADRLCSDLIVVNNRHKVYSAISHDVMDFLRSQTRVVEQISIDEAFLDMSDKPQPEGELARRLQGDIQTNFDLPCSIGVAANKLVAKIATDVGKRSSKIEGPPNAILVIPPGEEAAFLKPLPVEWLWGVGPKTAARLENLGITKIGQLAQWPGSDLARRFGKIGHDLARRAKGIDDRKLVRKRDAKSISRETTFANDIEDGETLRKTLRNLSESVARRLRRSKLNGTTIKLKIRWPDFTTLTRQTTFQQPTNRSEDIYVAAEQLFADTWHPGRFVRLLGVGVSGLSSQGLQLSLWDAAALGKEQRLDAAIKDLQDRYGDRAVWWGKERGE